MNIVSQGKRIKILYRKYIHRTISNGELKEMFEMLKDRQTLSPVREVLRDHWDNGEEIEELSSLDWETFRKRTMISDSFAAKPKKSMQPLMVRLTIAAGILLVVGIAAWFWMQRSVITIYETGYGEVREIVLNDGSHVRLNANSTLYWDVNGAEKGNRHARIDGEAFFNVAHHDGDPFLVSTPDLTVVVTGTAFNVTSRRSATQVFLESGKVLLRLHRKEHGEGMDTGEEFSGKNTVRMTPGEQLTYSSETDELVQKSNLTEEQAASWKTGELIYKNIPLSEVLQELSDVYGKNFTVNDMTLMDMKIDVGMPYKDWETVKELLQFMIDVQITETDHGVIIEK